MAGHVFISYNRDDQAYVERLAAYLEAAGVPVWIDRDLVHGDRWTSVIREQVDACAAFLPVMSPSADRSEWVEREILRAELKQKPIVPLLLIGEVFFRLANVQFEDVTGGRMPSDALVERLRLLTRAFDPAQSTSVTPLGSPPAPVTPVRPAPPPPSMPGATSAPPPGPGAPTGPRRLGGLRWVAVSVVTLLVITGAVIGIRQLAGTAQDQPGRSGTTSPAPVAGPDQPVTSSPPVTLVVDTFGEPGFDSIVAKYMSANPGVTVTIRKTSQLRDYLKKVDNGLASGTGLGDVVVLDEQQLDAARTDPSRWTDLTPFVGNRSSSYVSWAYEQGWSTDHTKLMALPSSMSGLALCYRHDLFAAAGLPTDRTAVGQMLSSWPALAVHGRDMWALARVRLLDNVEIAFAAMLQQRGGLAFFDRSNRLIAGRSEAVQDAWNEAVSLVSVSAGLPMFSAAWSQGFADNAFAATICPSWMLGVIQANAPKLPAGTWDIAPLPGGAGNWTGTWIGVPKSSPHAKAAADLVANLTSSASQKASWLSFSNLPSSLPALGDPAVLAYRWPYFGDAPIASIFGESLRDLIDTYRGPKYTAVLENAAQPALAAIEAGKLSPDAAWQQFLADAGKQAG